VRVNVGDVVKKGQKCWPCSRPTPSTPTSAQARAALQEAAGECRRGGGRRPARPALQSSGAISEQQVTQYLTAERTAGARGGRQGGAAPSSSCA
jgi:hypothetical protein